MNSPDIIARKITEKIASSSFKLLRNKKFRKLVELESFEQFEQDRIFNEIVISGISLGVLFFQTLSERAVYKDDSYLLEVKTELLSSYGNLLKKIGSSKDDADLFKVVIQMRVEEYQKVFKKNKKHLPHQKEVAWPFVVAIGGYDHIMRGKGKPDDPLFKMFLEWTKMIFKLILKIR